jgi:hypothetical protein
MLNGPIPLDMSVLTYLQQGMKAIQAKAEDHSIAYADQSIEPHINPFNQGQEDQSIDGMRIIQLTKAEQWNRLLLATRTLSDFFLPSYSCCAHA